MGDQTGYFSTESTNFDKSVHPYIFKALQTLLRGGLGYMPAGSVINAPYVGNGNDVTFRAFSIGDLPAGGDVSAEDTEDDADIEDLDENLVEFSGETWQRGVGYTTNADFRSPFALGPVAAERLARAIAEIFEDVARNIYGALAPELGGEGPITAAMVKQGVSILRSRDVKPLANGLYALVSDSLTLHDLIVDDDFIQESKYADPKTFLRGQVGVYSGVAIFDGGSRGIAVEDGSSVTTSLATIIGSGAIFLGDPAATKTNTVKGADHADPFARRNLVTATGFKGGVINDEQAVRALNIAAVSSLS